MISLIVLGLGMYLINNTTPLPDTSYRVHSSITPVKNYVEDCLMLSSIGPIDKIGRNGGTLVPLRYRSYFGEKYNYLCQNVQGECVNNLLLRQNMEQELSRAIKKNLTECIDLGIFRRQKFEVTDGDMNLSVNIGSEKVSIRLNYPIILKKENTILKIEKYDVEIRKPLGLLYEHAIDIVNSENTIGYFDATEFMQKNGGHITVQKHRPYPDIVYNISLGDYSFLFGLEGDKQHLESTQGCCYNSYDQMCFKDVPQTICENMAGIFDKNNKCICPQIIEPKSTLCDGMECKDCSEHEHGESWCEYDRKAGKGYDYVGTRHYLHSCIDGVEYIEECKDYRDELCTEETVLGKNKAMCRPNRWQDCYKCTSKSCCENLNFRDCQWKEWLTTENKCVPYVPPGFSFWDYEGIDVCSLATQTKECEGFSCPNIWVDDTAAECYMQGDCGNYRNIQDKLTKEGFFNSDLHDKVRDFVYLKDGENEKSTINLGINNRNTAEIVSTVMDSGDNFAKLISVGLNYLDTLSTLSPSDFLDPLKKPEFSVLDIAVCDVWHAPNGGKDCQKCGDSIHPCSEYWCKSLGKQCVFSEEDGFPYCNIAPDDKKGPIITFESVPGHEVRPAVLSLTGKTYHGEEIYPEIAPYELININLKTDKDSVCRMNYLPDLKYLRSPSYYLGNSQFGTNHSLNIRLPGDLKVPTRILDFFNITSMSIFADIFDNPEGFYGTYKNRYESQIATYEKASGKDINDKIEPYLGLVITFIDEASNLVPLYKSLFQKLITEFENGNYYVFIECKDFAGNRNAEDMFIKFSISNEDSKAPEIVGFVPENNSFLTHGKVKVYVNEPAECRFDYEDVPFSQMKQTLSCPTSQYESSSYYGGSYECSGSIAGGVYIRCIDNPQRIFKYPLSVAVGINKTPSVNVTGNKIIARAKSLNPDLVIEVPNNMFELELFVDNMMNCSLDTTAFSNCKKTDKFELGQYSCNAIGYIGSEKKEENTSFTLSLIKENITNTQVTLKQDKMFFNYTSQSLVQGFTMDDSVNIEFLIDKSMTCRYSSLLSGLGGNFVCRKINNQTACNAQLFTNNSYEVMCFGQSLTSASEKTIKCELPRERKQNVNAKSTYYVIKNESLEVTLQVNGSQLIAKTNRVATCGYYQDISLGIIKMQNNGLENHATLELEPGYHTIFVECKDSVSTTSEISFFVE